MHPPHSSKSVLGAALENFLSKKCFQMVFLSVQCCRYGVLYEYSSKKNLKKNYHVQNVYKLSFPTSFCLFGSLVAGFLVVFVLVLLLEGIFVGDILIGN